MFHQVTGHEQFGRTGVGFQIEQGDFARSTLAFGRVLQQNMSQFVTERETLSPGRMVRIQSDELILRTHQRGTGIDNRRELDHLKSELPGYCAECNGWMKRTVGTLEIRKEVLSNRTTKTGTFLQQGHA